MKRCTKCGVDFVDEVVFVEEWTISEETTELDVADLVAALIAEGGEIVEKRWPLSGIEIREPGRYLVYGPIPVESAEAKETP